MRSIAPWRYTTLSQVVSPTSSTTSDYSETSAAIFQDESVDIDTEPSYSCDAELDDELIGKALSSPLFTQEREEAANLRQTYHSHEESLLPAQSFFTRKSLGRPVYEPSSDLSQKRKSSRDLENERIKTLFERQKRANSCWSQKHEIQAASDRSIQELTGNIDCPRVEIGYTITGVWPIQARSITISRRTIRTKSGSSWNSYQEYARYGRIAEKSRVKGRGTFKKKIDWKPKHDYGAESPNSGITEWCQLYEWLERF